MHPESVSNIIVENCGILGKKGGYLMICRKCGNSIPESANKCPYCNARTINGWKNEGKKLIAPITDIFKKEPYYKKKK